MYHGRTDGTDTLVRYPQKKCLRCGSAYQGQQKERWRWIILPMRGRGSLGPKFAAIVENQCCHAMVTATIGMLNQENRKCKGIHLSGVYPIFRLNSRIMIATSLSFEVLSHDQPYRHLCNQFILLSVVFTLGTGKKVLRILLEDFYACLKSL
jgi:hypothetical protein